MKMCKMHTNGLVMFICAGLLLSGGCMLGGWATWNLLRMSYYFWLTDIMVELAPIAAIVGASLLCLPACWLSAAISQHPHSIPLVATLMCVLLAAMGMLSVGTAGLGNSISSFREVRFLNRSLREALVHDQYHPAVRSAWAAMQLELGTGCDVRTVNSGCLKPALAELLQFCSTISMLSSFILILLCVAMFSTAYHVTMFVLPPVSNHGLGKSLRIACVHAPTAPYNAHETPVSQLFANTQPMLIPTKVQHM